MLRARLALGVLGCCLLAAVATAAPKPPPPLYGRIGLPPDGSRVLAVMLKCSGDPLVRDVLYADTNFNGKFDLAEKTVAKPGEYQSRDYRHYVFPRVEVAGAPPCVLTLNYAMYRSGQAAVTVCGLNLSFSLSQEGQPWAYLVTHSLPLTVSGARSLKTAPLVGVKGPPALKVAAQPDPDKAGRTGFGVTLGWPAGALSIPGAPPPVQATLVVKDGAGKSVEEHTAGLDDFAFG